MQIHRCSMEAKSSTRSRHPRCPRIANALRRRSEFVRIAKSDVSVNRLVAHDGRKVRNANQHLRRIVERPTVSASHRASVGLIRPPRLRLLTPEARVRLSGIHRAVACDFDGVHPAVVVHLFVPRRQRAVRPAHVKVLQSRLFRGALSQSRVALSRSNFCGLIFP